MSDLRITVLKHSVPWGPFTREQIRDGLARGDFTLQYLAHAPGLKEWLPLGEVLDHVERSSILPPMPKSDLAMGLPAIPPRPSLAPEAPPPVPRLAPSQAQPPVAPPVLPVTEVEPIKLTAASFILRFSAFLIDCVILFLPIGLLFILGAIVLEVRGAWDGIDHESRTQEWKLLERNLDQLLLLVAIGLAWVYAAFLESSRWQGTVGKLWMGMKVTDENGERIGFLRATGRHAAKYLSALPFFLGFIMALFSSRGLALHDRMAGTYVVKR